MRIETVGRPLMRDFDALGRSVVDAKFSLSVYDLINKNKRAFGGYVSRHLLGFTLLELLVVVAIIGLLAAYVGPKYFGQLGKSEQAVAKSQIEAFSRALGAYRIDVGSYPSSEEGLNALVNRPADSARAAKWNGPYLEKAAPPDPWGKPYLYTSPGSKGDFDLLSYGKDGQPGGTGDAADVSNH